MRAPKTSTTSWRKAAHMLSCVLIALQGAPVLAAVASRAKPTVAAAAPLPATPVYRCVGADGRKLYSQRACDGADMTLMQVKDGRTTAQTRHAREMQKRTDKLSREMQRVRQISERKPVGRHAMALTGESKAGDAESKASRAIRRDAASGEKNKSSARKTASADARTPKPQRPAGFTARVPVSKEAQQEKRKSQS